MPTSDHVRGALAALLADHAVSDPLYDALPFTDGGKVLNADAARELSPHYRTPADRLRFTDCTYGPCRDYVRRRFDRAVAAPAPEGADPRSVLFLAGGAGSGKSTALTGGAVAEPDLIFDSNFADVVKARAMIDAALSNRWEVVVAYVHRSFPLAAEGMLYRASVGGRYVPLYCGGSSASLADLHYNAQRAIRELHRRFAKHPDVRIGVFENTWSATDGSGGIESATIDDVAAGGRLAYTSLDALHGEQDEAVGRARGSGRYADDLLVAVTGRP